MGLTRHVSLRVIQANWLRTQMPNATTNVQNNLLLRAGVVFHARLGYVMNFFDVKVKDLDGQWHGDVRSALRICPKRIHALRLRWAGNWVKSKSQTENR
jgi:hypothetical protein